MKMNSEFLDRSRGLNGRNRYLTRFIFNEPMEALFVKTMRIWVVSRRFRPFNGSIVRSLKGRFCLILKGGKKLDKEQFIQRYAVERQGTNAVKWDALKERFGADDLLPIWVADMEFSTPETVKQALIQRIEHGAFGYTQVAQGYFEAYQGWQDRHEQTKFEKDWLYFSTGVVQSFYDLIACFSEEGEGVLIQPPVYYPFFYAIQDQKRALISSELILVENRYVPDFVDFEEKIKTHRPKIFLLCSPHNPLSRVWHKEEIAQLLEICHRYQVLVISDEIHSDLILPGHAFVSTVTVAKELGYLDEVFVLNAPSKTFNLASLLNSHVWIPGEEKRNLYENWVKRYKQTENSLLGQLAAKTAYETGDEWLEGLLAVVASNYAYVKETFAKELPKIIITPLEGTYLAWIDLRAYVSEQEVKKVVQDTAKLAVDFGEWFSPNAQGFIRLNLATIPQNVEQAVQQLVAAIKK